MNGKLLFLTSLIQTKPDKMLELINQFWVCLEFSKFFHHRRMKMECFFKILSLTTENQDITYINIYSLKHDIFIIYK